MTPSQAVWRITVTNEGPNNTVSDVLVVDDLPAGLTYEGVEGDGWTCNAVGQTVNCVHPDVIKVDRSSSFKIDTSIATGTTGEITNTASVSPGGEVASATGEIPEQVAPGGGGLPGTGGLPFAWVILGLLSLLAGSTLVVVARRRD